MTNFFSKIKDLFEKWIQDPFFLGAWERDYYFRRPPENDQLSRSIRVRKGGTYPYYGTSSMFIDDMYMGIMPFMHYRGEREKYAVRMEPDLPEKRRMMAEGISSHSHEFFLEDALSDFVRNAAHTLFQNGIAIFEINTKRDQEGQITEFDFEHISPHYLFRLFNHYYQVIPWWVAKESNLRVQVIKIPKEKILKINFPPELTTRRKLIKLLKRIWWLGQNIIPDFHMKAMEKNESIGFDHKLFAKEKYMEVAIRTRVFGWSQRQTGGDYISEYYSMVRFLREKKAEALVRETIISRLNDALSGSILNFGTRIEMVGLPTVRNVEEQERRLKEGGVAFMDLFNTLKIT